MKDTRLLSSQASATTVEPDKLRAVLMADRAWSAYAIADLQPSYAPYCRWTTGRSAGGSGVVLLFTRLDMPVLFATGDVAAVAEAMDVMDAPETVYMTLREEHLPAAERFYDFSADVRPMWRMAYRGARLNGRAISRSSDRGGLVRLTPAHTERIRALIAQGGPFAPDAFEPYQTEEGVFYGIEDASGELAAVGGTHVVDWRGGVAAIGNMYTHPARRGLGFGSAVLRALVAELEERGASTIILNVDQRNEVARRLYERNGFSVHCPYWEGVGVRRA